MNKGIRNGLMLVIILASCQAYKPVVLMHGIMSDAGSMLVIEKEIERYHPGTIVYNLDLYNNWASLENAWGQIESITEQMKEIFDNHPDGVHLLGYSQGGLMARAFLQTYSEHKVKNFISLSSPQAGQFGDSFLHLIFPSLIAKQAYNLFYSHVGQKTSVGNYWNDPQQRPLYLKYSIFLPYINNEVLCTRSAMFRNNLLKLDKMVLIGGPHDGVISPWQSAHFGFFDLNGTVVEMKERQIYSDDSIGLKALDKLGKLKLETFENVKHPDWHIDMRVIDKAVLPHLD